MVFIVAATVAVGANTVLCRYLNAMYAKRNGLSMGTLINYVTGLAVSLLVLLLLGDPFAIQPIGTLTPRTAMMFLGGTFGVGMMQLFIYITPRLPAFHSTIVIFSCQLGGGMMLDIFLYHTFSLSKLLGVLLVLLGLVHYMWVSNRSGKKQRPASPV